MKLKAAIFDFDGLILDTEGPEFIAWGQVFREEGAELAFDDWARCIGTADAFDPPAHLERLLGKAIDRAAADQRRKTIHRALLAKEPLRPGVVDRLEEAREKGIATAIASSSPSVWVERHLGERNLRGYFQAVVVRNEILPAKPKPDLYLAALKELGVRAEEAVAFEDSTNGILAAKAAGIYCVAVPNSLTARLDLSMADRKVESMADVTLGELDLALMA